MASSEPMRAFPASPTATNRRGINGTDWITVDRAAYDACLDPPAPSPPSAVPPLNSPALCPRAAAR